MKTFVGIDLGSTTTKAVLLDEDRNVIGHGITNSRSNYATAARVASQEAHVDGQFTLFRRALTDAQRTDRARQRSSARWSGHFVSSSFSNNSTISSKPASARFKANALPRPGPA